MTLTVVRDIANIRFTDPVDGTRRTRGPDKGTRQPVDHLRVKPEVWDAAKAALREGERLLIVSATEVRTVYK